MNYLVVGLGNPGNNYLLNRHNIGFMAIDVIHASFPFSSFQEKFSAYVSEAKLPVGKTILCKPQTFMNLSGNAVSKIAQFYKIPLENIYVFHDDLDLEAGRIKVKKGGSSGGHNGLGSIDQQIGKDYWRIRIGISRPKIKEEVSSYVLSNFTKKEINEWVGDTLPLFAIHFEELFKNPVEWPNTLK